MGSETRWGGGCYSLDSLQAPAEQLARWNAYMIRRELQLRKPTIFKKEDARESICSYYAHCFVICFSLTETGEDRSNPWSQVAKFLAYSQSVILIHLNSLEMINSSLLGK